MEWAIRKLQYEKNTPEASLVSTVFTWLGTLTNLGWWTCAWICGCRHSGSIRPHPAHKGGAHGCPAHTWTWSQSGRTSRHTQLKPNRANTDLTITMQNIDFASCSRMEHRILMGYYGGADQTVPAHYWPVCCLFCLLWIKVSSQWCDCPIQYVEWFQDSISAIIISLFILFVVKW